MNVLVTGSGGQLGSEIKEIYEARKMKDFIFRDIDLDITDSAALNAYFRGNPTDTVVNCAAYTAVDRAEKEKKAAFLLNKTACSIMAGLSRKYGFRLLHISTDFVFDGKKSTPYIESDKPGPVSVYGLSKLGGERAIISSASSYIIIRTSWLYSSFGSNFVKTILKAAGERDELRVVYDQVGSPTYARDLALAILEIIPRFEKGMKEIYHYSNEGVASWYDFARSVCQFAGVRTPVIPIETAEYPTPARRPSYSVLSKRKIKEEFGLKIPYWRDSLEECVSLIGEGV